MEFSDPKLKRDQAKFSFVQRDEKLYDKKFETKPVGYFKDAMIRFGKNRTNVIATAILFTLIVMSIIFPTFTTKNYTALETRMAFLPPRVPIIERLGILDGIQQVESQQIDRSTIDPVTGLGVPNSVRYPTAFILMDSLENYDLPCSEKIATCIGGSVRFQNRVPDSVSVFESQASTFSDTSANPFISVSVDSFIGTENTLLEVLAQDGLTGGYVVVGTINEAGEYRFELNDAFESTGFFSTRIQLRFTNEATDDLVQLNRVSLADNRSETPLINDGGFALSMYNIAAGTGRSTRFNAIVTMARFRFDAYQSALGNYRISTFSQEEYNSIVLNHAGACERISNPANPAGWLHGENCPVQEVIRETSPIVVDGVEFRSYSVIMNYRLFRGYDEELFFIAGTTGAGRDLFNLTWVALRTSLLIGVAAAIVNITIGIIYGAISGYYGGKIDILMERFSEVIARIPFLVVLAISIAYIGPGITTLFIVLIVSGWIGIASVTRTQFYRYKGREYVLASRTLGAKDTRLIFRHILPNGIGTIITASILSIPLVIFTESTLSYLGFGIGHGQEFNLGPFSFSGVSIGVLLADGRAEIVDKPYLTIFPAIIISILMITFNMFGNALRDAFNPTLRGSN
jgi:ABC-type dipeptide/oligopeptide/nickel transport system permease subunit